MVPILNNVVYAEVGFPLESGILAEGAQVTSSQNSEYQVSNECPGRQHLRPAAKIQSWRS